MELENPCFVCDAKSRKILELEDECDALAFENMKLVDEIKFLREKLSQVGISVIEPNEDSSSEDDKVTLPAKIEIKFEGSEFPLPTSEMFRIDNASSGKNIISCAFLSLQSPIHGSTYAFLCGGVDNMLHCYLPSSRALLFTHKFTAPVISIDTHDSLIACSLMDGSLGIIESSLYLDLLRSIDPSSSETTTITTLPNDLLACYFDGDLNPPEDLLRPSLLPLLPRLSLCLQVLKPHSKYVTCVQWSEDGKLLASLSSDQTVCVFRRTRGGQVLGQGGGQGLVQKVATLSFPSAPESLVFAPCTAPSISTSESSPLLSPSSSEEDDEAQVADTAENSVSDRDGDGDGDGLGSSGWELIVSLKGSAHLLYFDLTSLASTSPSPLLSLPSRQVCLNEKDWDSHVSFSALHLSLSPPITPDSPLYSMFGSGRMLCVATDHSHLYLYRLGSNQRLRTLVGGFLSKDISKPRVCWDPTGELLYCTSEGESVCYLYSVPKEREVGRLEGHRGLVRDIAVRPKFKDSPDWEREVITVSYDHSLRVWK